MLCIFKDFSIYAIFCENKLAGYTESVRVSGERRFFAVQITDSPTVTLLCSLFGFRSYQDAKRQTVNSRNSYNRFSLMEHLTGRLLNSLSAETTETDLQVWSMSISEEIGWQVSG